MEVIITPQAKKQIKKLPKVSQLLIIERLKKIMSGQVSNVKILTGYKNAYRIRVGDYRIVYRLIRKKVFIVLVGHRNKIYLMLRKLMG